MVLNKADRSESLGWLKSGRTKLELMDLFGAISANDEQMEYRTMYGSARGGWITDSVNVALDVAQSGIVVDKSTGGSRRALDMGGLIDTMLEDIPAPSVHWYVDKREDVNGDDDYVACEKGAENFNDQPFSMTATTVGYDPYLGRTCTRRVYSGRAMIGDGITLLHRRLTDNKADGTSTTPTAAAATTTAATTTATLGPSSQVTGIFANRGVSRAPLDPPLAIAGDIVTLPGVPDSTRVGDTLTSTGRMVPAAPAASTTPRRHP